MMFFFYPHQTKSQTAIIITGTINVCAQTIIKIQPESQINQLFDYKKMKFQLFSLVAISALFCTAAQVSDGGSVVQNSLTFPSFDQQMNQFALQNMSGSELEEKSYLRSNAHMR
jgi:hypothetical protein